MQRWKPAPLLWIPWIGAAVSLCGMAIFFSGCRRELSQKEVKSITGELARAARRAARRTADVRVVYPKPLTLNRQGSGLTKQERIRTRQETRELRLWRGEPSALVPLLRITLRDRSRLDAIRAALLRVGHEHKLSVVKVDSPAPPTVEPTLKRYGSGPAGAIEQLEFRFRGRPSHMVLMESAPAPKQPWPTHAETAPRVAIVIDDMGADLDAAEKVFEMPYPLTVAVLPRQPHSAEVAERAYQEGLDVMLHLPMEPVNSQAKREETELQPGMSASQVRRTVAEAIESVPHVAGLNNHEGSKATADPALMRTLMNLLREEKLFFVDSRTTPHTVAYEEAFKAQVPAAYRTMFLDSAAPDAEDSVAYTIGQLKQLERQARGSGWAVAIGHPQPSTLAALARYLPQLERKGFRLVFASELVAPQELPLQAPTVSTAKRVRPSLPSRSK